MPLTLNGTTGVAGVDGSSSTPALQGTDTNTGVVFGTDTVSLVTGGSTALSADSSQNVTVGGTLAMGSSFKRNRIINGDMRVDQRATAATTSSTYSVDRWNLLKLNDATESVAQNSDAPTGFSYSLRNTISVADTSIGATQFSGFQQQIEGFNVADLGYGTANAKTITISFWIKSTVTGQYTACLLNAGDSRVCPLGFTISASNIWEYKTITVAGCTDGTWNTTNGAGLRLIFWAALGSDYAGGTSGVWTSTGSIKYGVSSPVNGIGTNGNIFAITGVQLEVGSVATPYERQIYSEQLAQCQRYYYRMTETSNNAVGMCNATTTARLNVTFPTQMRIAPTALEQSGTAADYNINSGSSAITCSAVPAFLAATANNTASTFTVASGLTTGNGALGRGAGYLAWSAEL